MNPPDPIPAEPASHAGSVLLVDDERALLEIYAAILEQRFDVSLAGNAAEADVLLRQKSFKVILADHLMPGETGLSFLARVRIAYPHIQRILVTGNMTAEMQQAVTESNLLFAFMVKPITLSELIGVVQSAVRVHDSRFAATP